VVNMGFKSVSAGSNQSLIWGCKA